MISDWLNSTGASAASSSFLFASSPLRSVAAAHPGFQSPNRKHSFSSYLQPSMSRSRQTFACLRSHAKQVGCFAFLILAHLISYLTTSCRPSPEVSYGRRFYLCCRKPRCSRVLCSAISKFSLLGCSDKGHLQFSTRSFSLKFYPPMVWSTWDLTSFA